MKKINHPYPPFDFNFYMDTNVSFEQDYQREDEFKSSEAFENKNFFHFTPYIRGYCNICGKESVFFCKNLVHPRDYLTCMHCGSTSRYRSIARGIISALQELTSKKIKSLFDLQNINLERKIVIYDTQLPFSLGIVTYPIPYFLSLNKNIELHLSDFNCKKDKIGPHGEIISIQDLQNLNYESGKFDIVITSDVMEHVRLPRKAHSEISRVTKKGGYYIFTVPHFRHTKKTHQLVKIHDENDSSKDEHLVEPVYHGDPNSGGGALVYQVFGLDIEDELKELSFDTSYTDEKFIDVGIVGTELFVCKKNKDSDDVKNQNIRYKKPSLLKRILSF